MSKPLNVSTPTSNSKTTINSRSINAPTTPTEPPTNNAELTSAPTPLTRPEDATSPHELTAFVESMLTQLESRFDEMSGQIIDRMSQMSSRVDALENAIHDLINGDLAVPPTPGAPVAVNGGPTARQISSDSIDKT
ncbi:heat shock factor binding protein 1-domain-containing protein [Cantharellus anzutake]|uniref:heat shock factor binding protein 1-domain-containing protein n=1 Tax=Cantharellus anzutake TaxID=1750568 RepID=UPI00190753EB|nr:heat shock factor binding protein 1-domain-containing protein [Cantharellus anzutake]KAF8339665.1 heat shock factor binding protein 1-domain-containing protein [Cantharellus anzutake]